MASYVKFELEDGTMVYLETTDSPRGSSGLIPKGGNEAAAKAAVSFEQSIDSVRKMAGAMLNSLREGSTEQPEEIQVNFGLKASSEIGNLVVSRGGIEANYNVMIRWRHSTEAETEDQKPQDGKEKSED